MREFVQDQIPRGEEAWFAPGVGQIDADLAPREDDVPGLPRFAGAPFIAHSDDAVLVRVVRVRAEIIGIDEDALQVGEGPVVMTEPDAAGLRRHDEAHRIGDLQAFASFERVFLQKQSHALVQTFALDGIELCDEGHPVAGHGDLLGGKRCDLAAEKAGEESNHG